MNSTKHSKAYRLTLTNAFEHHYRTNTDVWSSDQSLDEASYYAAKLATDAIKRPLQMLDIGCGNGRQARHLADKLGGYVGIDLVAHEDWFAGVEATKKSIFVAGNFLDYPLASTSFDLVLDHGCFHHQHPDDQDTYLRKLSGSLQLGGLLSIVVWAEAFIAGDIDAHSRFHWFFEESSFTERLATLGLAKVDCRSLKSKHGTWQLHLVLEKRG